MTSSLTIGHLTCEFRTDPMGVEAPRPRLGWLLAGSKRADRQSAYRVLVASAPEALARDHGDLWDSGRVVDERTAHLAYAGTPLAPRQRAWWKAMAWDAAGAATPWSAVAHWERGLGEPWRARWIGGAPQGDLERLGMVGCQWIREATEAPAGGMLEARLRFELPAGGFEEAFLEFVCDGYPDPWNRPRAYILVNGRTHDNWQGRNTMRAPTRWSILPFLAAGANELALRAPRTDGCAILAQVVVAYADGRRLRFASGDAWQARVTADPGAGAPADDGWERGAGWSPARPVGAFGQGPFPSGHIYNAMDRLVPPLVFRHDWRADRPISSARIYATACGIYELRLNGERVGDHQLSPGWTDYRKRMQYQCFDVGALLRAGANCLTAVVADGWHSGSIFFGGNWYGTEKALLCQLHVRYQDGAEEVIASGPDWLCATGAIRSADLFMGQVEDRRLALVNWADGPLEARQWRPARALTPAVGSLEAQSDEPIRATVEMPPRTIREVSPGTWLIDFGQNLAGRLRILIGGESGRVVTIRHGEMLAKDGSLYTGNLRSARAVDQVVCDGSSAWFEPAFTFHGFRYAEVRGLASPPNPEEVRAVVLNSDCPWSGAFSCSDPRLEQLHSNIRWGQRSNFISVPTDCPQRDERAGWTGDAQIFVGTAAFNMACAPFFAKYQRDMVDAQHENGAFPDFAPTGALCDFGRFGWGDAGVTVPWTMWRTYGDTRIIEENLPHMMRWVEHRTARAKDWLNTDWSFGDWVSPPPQTPNDVLSPIYHYWTALQVAQMAEAIGAAGEAARCRAIAAHVQSAWLAKHVDARGRISSDTQTAYALALRTTLAPPGVAERMAPHFIAAIERANWHLHTGFLGTGHLLPALSAIGREDVAFRLLVTDTYPSWLYPLKHGATTMWERWDGYHAELGPQNVGNMNSYNHYAFGAVGEWMYATIGGLEAIAVGGARWRIRPRPGGVLTHASASFRSVLGTVACAWSIRDGRFHLAAEVPVGAEAEVHLPTRDPSSATEGARPLASGCEGLRATRQEEGALVLTVGSGRYAFAAAQ